MNSRNSLIYEYILDQNIRRLTSRFRKRDAQANQLEAPISHPQSRPRKVRWSIPGLAMLAFSLGGITRTILPTLQVETAYRTMVLKETVQNNLAPVKPLPKAVPVLFDPLTAADGTRIIPANETFAIVVPKVGINAPVIPAVNPADTKDYEKALKEGVAHASTSFFPDENGVVYLFSHSTNYDWFVRDLNAVFYLLKNLEIGDLIVVVYKGKQYTYVLREKRVVKPTEVSLLAPIAGQKSLILQTCWPPGSTTGRLLIFADLIEEQNSQIYQPGASPREVQGAEI